MAEQGSATPPIKNGQKPGSEEQAYGYHPAPANSHRKHSDPGKRGNEFGEAIEDAFSREQFDRVEEELSAWLKEDPQGAFEFVNQLAGNSHAEHCAHELFQFLKTQNPSAAWELASLLQKWPQIRISVVSDRFTEMMKDDSNKAIDLLEKLGPKEIEVATTLAYQSARKGNLGEPAQAMEDLLSKPDSSLQSELISGCLEHWLSSSIDEATDFLNHSPPNELFDKATMSYSESAAFLDPEAAMTWANALVHPSLREEAQRRVSEIGEGHIQKF